ncbi:hypothetical protein O181_097526 [Austropuccinia psidii MF-1]|uniref:Uncharacterized protein n=1 Tax=Austropuccinia psidii MF-1 TaxID=1389203 RepID=A0A9Q3PF63_9BASI|nr:hypothetical protein [Austropuccinia psidii MF-1]
MAIIGHFEALGSYGPWALGAIGGPQGQNGPPGPNSSAYLGIPWDQKMAHGLKISPTWPGPIEGVQDHQDPGLPKVCLAKGKDCFQHYNPQSSKCHYCFIGKKPCRCTGVPSSNFRRYLWSRKDGPFGKEFPVSEAPTPDGTSGFSKLTGSRQRDVARWTNVGGPIQAGGRLIYSSSEVAISRINTEGVVKRIKRISDSPTDPDAEASCQQIPSTPRIFQTALASIPTMIPPSSPSASHARPALNPAVRPSPSQKPRNSPITTSQQLQPMASSSRRRDRLSPLPFPAAQVFQTRDCWPIQITREDPNVESESQEAVVRLFRRVDRNSREVIMYANDRTIPGTASEEMAAKFSWYEDELISEFQSAFDDLGRDN